MKQECDHCTDFDAGWNCCYCPAEHKENCISVKDPKMMSCDCYSPSNCRSGCPTQDHKTYGECLQAARIGIDKTSLKVKE